MASFDYSKLSSPNPLLEVLIVIAIYEKEEYFGNDA